MGVYIMIIEVSIEEEPIEVLKGAYALLEGLKIYNKDGEHIQTNQAMTILESIIRNATLEIDKRLNEEIK